jgi:replicative DNA helicase
VKRDEAEIELPSNPEAERLVLGSIFATKDADVFSRVQDLVTESAFTVAKFRLIFVAMSECFKENREINVGTVFLELKKRNVHEQAGSMADWMSGFPGLYNIEAFCAELLESERQRRLWLLGQQLQQQALSRESSDSITAGALGELERTNQGKRARRGTRPSEILARVGGIDGLVNPSRSGGILTPWHRVNKATNGMRPGKMWTVGALPGTGKTSFCTQILGYAVEHEGSRAIIFSREMAQEEILFYMACSRAGVDSQALQAGEVSYDHRVLFQESLAFFTDNADDFLEIDDETDTTAGISAKLRKMENQGRPADLVAIDYLQLVHGIGKFGSRREEVDFIAYGIKDIAIKFHKPVLVPAQLNVRKLIAPEKEAHGKFFKKDFAPGPNENPHARVFAPPTQGDFRESGAVEQASDLAWIFQLTDPDQEFRRVRLVDGYLLKQRGGPKGKIPFRFHSAVRTFEEIPLPAEHYGSHEAVA